MIGEELKERLYQERERWFPWLAVLFASGIGLYFVLPQEPLLWLTLGVWEALVFAAIILRDHRSALIVIALISLIAFGFGYMQLKAVYLSKQEQVKTEQDLYISGTVEELDYNSKGKQRLVLTQMKDFDENEIKGRYKITLQSKKESFNIGDEVELAARVDAPSPAVMVGGYQFDRKTFFDGINGTGFALSRTFKLGEDKSGENKPLIEKIRSKIVNRIESVLPADEAGIATALIAGERFGISDKITEDYQNSGLAHFLSISGLHMSMLAGFMFLLVRSIIAAIPPLALRVDSKKISAIIAVILSAIYLAISGGAIPTQRAFIMTFIVLLGIMFSRQAISMRTISWAAIIVLLITPQALIGASFQMSFAAVVALIAFYESSWKGLIHREQKSGFFALCKAYIIGILVSDFIASVATLPFSIYHFNKIAIYTTIGNLLAGPIIGLWIMPSILIVMLLMLLGLDYYALIVLGKGIGLVNDITAKVASLPHAGLPVLSMPLWGLVAIVYGGLWLCIWQKKWRHFGWIAIIIGAMSMITTKVPDVLIDASGKAVAVKDEQGDMVVLPSRGKYFVKQIWLDKTSSPELSKQQKKELTKITKGKAENKNWLDMTCADNQCLYKNKVNIIKNKGIEIDGKPFDSQQSLGASIYINDNKIKIDTVREYIGHRLWNE